MKFPQVVAAYPAFHPHTTGGDNWTYCWELPYGDELLLVQDEGQLPTDDDSILICAHFDRNGNPKTRGEDCDEIAVDQLAEWIEEHSSLSGHYPS